MTHIDGKWHDDDVLADELAQALDFTAPPPPLRRWLLDEQAVRRRLGEIYEDMLRWSSDSIDGSLDKQFRAQARRCVALQIAAQVEALFGETLAEAERRLDEPYKGEQP
jgi:uncharacterized membrane protein YccC